MFLMPQEWEWCDGDDVGQSRMMLLDDGAREREVLLVIVEGVSSSN
jgi:hypothetical protein